MGADRKVEAGSSGCICGSGSAEVQVPGTHAVAVTSKGRDRNGVKGSTLRQGTDESRWRAKSDGTAIQVEQRVARCLSSVPPPPPMAIAGAPPARVFGFGAR